jgi:hypothetical protein
MTLKSSTGQIEQPEKNQLFDQIRNDNLEKFLNPNIVANFPAFCSLLIPFHPTNGSTVMSFQSAPWC